LSISASKSSFLSLNISLSGLLKLSFHGIFVIFNSASNLTATISSVTVVVVVVIVVEVVVVAGVVVASDVVATGVVVLKSLHAPHVFIQLCSTISIKQLPDCFR